MAKKLLMMNITLFILAVVLFNASLVWNAYQERVFANSSYDEVHLLLVVPEYYQHTNTEKGVVAILKLFNFTSEQKQDIIIQYELTDVLDNVLKQSSETVAVYTQASFAKFFDVPPDFTAGEYKIKARLYTLDNELVGSTSTKFAVGGTPLVAIGNLSQTENVLFYAVIITFTILALNLVAYVIIVIRTRARVETA